MFRVPKLEVGAHFARTDGGRYHVFGACVPGALVVLVLCPEIGPEFARQTVKPHSPVTGFVDLIFGPNFGPPSEPENRVVSSARFLGECES